MLLTIAYLSAISTLIPLVAGAIRYRALSHGIKLLFLYVVISVLLESINYILFSNKINNLFVFHIHTVTEFILLSLFYIAVLHPSVVVHFMKAFLILFLGISLSDVLWGNGPDAMDSVSSSVESFIFLIYAIVTFYIIIKRMEYVDLVSTPVFWFNTGILTYFAGNMFLFIFSNYILNEGVQKELPLWTIHSALNTIFNILFAIGFWKVSAK